jgi:Hypoxia induced protein conserved region
MSALFTYLVPLSVAAVFAVLMLGLYTMTHGKSPNLSQTLMRWRVGLQFIAIVVIMAAVYIKRSAV